MSLKIVPAILPHLQRIRVQAEHQRDHAGILEVLGSLSSDELATVLRWSYTAVEVIPLSKRHCRLRVAAVCGITKSWAWALLADGLDRGQMAPIHRRVSKVLFDHAEQVGPVLVKIDGFFTPGVRWARMLGFKPIDQSDTWVYYHDL